MSTTSKQPLPPAQTPTTVNGDLQDLHDMLVGIVSDLSRQIGQVNSNDDVQAIIREIDEVNHRVTLTGNLLFTQMTVGITNAMNRVRNAKSDIDNAITRINEVTGFVKSVSSFLTLVDKAIDMAKLAALV